MKGIFKKIMTIEKGDQQQFLENQIGGKWIGIQFNTEPRCGTECIHDKMSICEVIKKITEKNLILPTQQISCLGGLRSVGCLPNEEDLFIHVSEATGLSYTSIRTMIQKNALSQ